MRSPPTIIRELCEALAELATAASYLEAEALAGGTPERFEAFVISDGTRRGRITAAADRLERAPVGATSISMDAAGERIIIQKGPQCRQ
jgi:hypothetical protein